MAKRFFLSLLLIFLIQSNVSQQAFGDTPKRGGILRFGLDSDISSLNPFQRTMSVNKQTGSISFEGLLTIDNQENLKPALATSWDVSKNSQEYTFHLRKGVKFHNGQGMTAEDVIWAIEYAKDPKNGAYGRDKLKGIQSVTAPDPMTVHIVLKEPYVPFLVALAGGHDTFPVIPKGSVPYGRSKLDKFPSGTGPFMMTEYQRREVAKFKRFDDYWQKGLPYLDGVEFHPLPDPTVRFTALRTGEIDMMTKLIYDFALRVKNGEFPGVMLDYSETGGYRGLIFNTKKEPFNDVRVRQAVKYAIDKKEIIDGITLGLGRVWDQKVPIGSRWVVPLKKQERDLAKAKALMKEAGHENGFTTKVEVSRGWPNPQVMQFIQRQVADIGIKIELQFVNFAQNQRNKRSGNFEMNPLGGAVYLDPDLAYYQYFHSEKTDIKVSNFPQYDNARVDELLEMGRKEPNFEKRHAIYKEFLEAIDRDAPQITIGFIPNPFAMRTFVKDFEQRRVNNDFYFVVAGLGHTWLDK